MWLHKLLVLALTEVDITIVYLPAVAMKDLTVPVASHLHNSKLVMVPVNFSVPFLVRHPVVVATATPVAAGLAPPVLSNLLPAAAAPVAAVLRVVVHHHHLLLHHHRHRPVVAVVAVVETNESSTSFNSTLQTLSRIILLNSRRLFPCQFAAC